MSIAIHIFDSWQGQLRALSVSVHNLYSRNTAVTDTFHGTYIVFAYWEGSQDDLYN